MALQWSGASEIFVPKIGLSDGMIKVLYRENNLSVISAILLSIFAKKGSLKI